MHGPAVGIFFGAFGVTAALLLVGGFLTLRFQRNRFRFLLIQAGLEKGINPLTGAPPLWLMSLRRGTMAIAVGVCLILIGIAVGGAASKVPMPTDAEARATVLPAEMAPPDSRPVDAPRAPDGGPMDHGPMGGPMGGPPRFDRRDDRAGPPPRELPAVEAWHRAQDRKTLAGLSGSAGLILAVLGTVRVLFALAERRYADHTGDLV